jgi:hypothetical protein
MRKAPRSSPFQCSTLQFSFASLLRSGQVFGHFVRDPLAYGVGHCGCLLWHDDGLTELNGVVFFDAAWSRRAFVAGYVGLDFFAHDQFVRLSFILQSFSI